MIDPKITLEDLNKRNTGNMAENLGMEFTDVGENYLTATMPVDHRTVQPMGLLHGGASAALAETVGSMASYISVDRTKFYCVGLEIKCNHLRSKTSGTVSATATPIHTGKKVHVWNIRITDENEKLIAYCTLTMAVLPLSEEQKSKIDPENAL